MNQKLNKAIDREIKKESIRRSRKWILLGLGILLVLAVYTPVFSERMTGETVGFKVDGVGNTAKIQMKIRADSGKDIAILVDKGTEQHLGRKVEISKMTSVAGMASYQFVGYLEADDQ